MKNTISSLKNKKLDTSLNESKELNKCDNHPLNIKTLVNPTDFEDIYFHSKKNVLDDHDCLSIKIPEKDVEMNVIPRKQTVFNNGVPLNIQDIYSSNLLAKLCIEYYTSDWIVTCYKDLSYNGAFWSLPNIHKDLCNVKEQKFSIDDEKDKDTENIFSLETKSTYLESLLAVCTLEDYQIYLRHKDNGSRINNIEVTNKKKYATPTTTLFSLSELSDGTKVLSESVPRDGRVQEIIYIDIVDTISELDENWIKISFKTKKKPVCLYTGNKENQELWFQNFNEAIDILSDKLEGSGTLNSLERVNDTVQEMLSKILQESDQSANELRSGDHQKILTVSADALNHIKKKSPPPQIDDSKSTEKSILDDSLIRSQVEQICPRICYKLTAQRLFTSIYYSPDNAASNNTRTLPEPFFISCCLVHINDNRRISEEFQWNPNHPTIENLLPKELFTNRWGPKQPQDENHDNLYNKTPLNLPTFTDNALQNCKSFIVKSPYNPEQVVILIRIDKVFCGISTPWVDKYVKYGVMSSRKGDGDDQTLVVDWSDNKSGNSIHKAMTTFCANIGHYRMPFCWSFCKLKSQCQIKLPLYRYDGNKTSDEDLFKLINNLNLDSTNKVMTIPGFIELSINEILEGRIHNMTDLVNSELICRVKSNPSVESSCCKEIKEFISDPLNMTNSSSFLNYQIKSSHSSEGSSITSNSRPNSNFELAAVVDDENSSGDVTPSGDVYNSNFFPLPVGTNMTPDTILSSRNHSEQDQMSSDKSLDSINPEDLVIPFLDFVHSLYLYPRMLNFSNQSIFQRARNLSCFVELRDSDLTETSIPLKTIFSKPSNKQPAFDSWANTSVIYHDSCPTFNEEIKIALPINISPKHHFLFRFYHVSCETAGTSIIKDRTSTKKLLETPVGFAWIPLLDKNLNINTGKFNLRVATNLPTNYLDESNQMAITKKDDSFRGHSTFSLPRMKAASESIDKNLKRNSNSYVISSQRQKDVTELNALPDLKESTGSLIDSTHIHWVDGQKPLFSVVLKPESTIYTKNLHLHRFFRICQDKFKDLVTNDCEKNEVLLSRSKTGNDHKDPSNEDQTSHGIAIRNAMKALVSVEIQNLIPFLGPTFNQLFIIIVNTCTTSPKISETAVTSIINLSSALRGQSVEVVSQRAIRRNTTILKNYVKYSFDTDRIVLDHSKTTVHDCLVRTISELISPTFRDTNFMHSFLQNSFLLYSVIVKSMIQSSMKQAKLNIDSNQSTLLTTSFTSYLEIMIGLIVNCILDVSCNISNQQGIGGNSRNQNISAQSLSSSANKDLARFIARLFNVMDRAFIFRGIYQYMKVINGRIKAHSSDRDHLSKLKFEFLEIICQHEHFIALNLIDKVKQADQEYPVPEMSLSETFCQEHYLIGLILQQVDQQMCNTFSSYSIRRLPFLLLRNILTKHTFDDRYKDSLRQFKIARLYLPLVSIILDNQRSLSMPGTTNSNISVMNDSSDKSLSSRQISLFSADTVSTHSSIDGSGSEGGGGSIYGVATGAGALNGKSTRSRQSYLDKEGRVESHFLNMIAGLNTEGGFRDLSTRRKVDSDTSSIHSTSTLIGLEELDEMESVSLGDEMIVHTKIELSDISSRRGSVNSSLSSNNSSQGRRIPATLNLKRNMSATHTNQRMSSGLGVNAANTGINKNNETKSPLCLDDKTQKDVFICLMYIFSTISSEDVKTIILNLTVQSRAEFLQLLIYAIHHLKYQGKKAIYKFESISRCEIKTGHGQALLRSNVQKKKASRTGNDDDQNTLIFDGNVSTEVGLIVLDVLSLYCVTCKQEMLTYNPDHALFRRIIDVYLTLLVVNQSDTVLRHVFVSLRIFVGTFAKVIFANCHSVLCDLSLQVLRYCDSRSISVRTEACGFIYRMLRSSYEYFNRQGLNRVHLQMIVAVSKLDRIVGRRFNQSLSYLRELAELEMKRAYLKPVIKPKPISRSHSSIVAPIVKMDMQIFYEEVSDLTQRIRTVLMATVKMNEHKDDPEMLVDLQYSLAKSYSSNPALRRTWLEKIISVHEKTNAKAEIAMCKAHIAAMICEYLKRKELFSLGCDNFRNVTLNIPNEESAFQDDSVQLEVHYSKEEVVQLLRDVAQAFDVAGLWEVLKHVYNLIIPIYEKKRDYEQLEQIYEHLSAAYGKIKNSEGNNQRLIGSYYQVVFYGKPFESLARKMFIYRLDSGKPFCVAREELQVLFEKKYGRESVNMLVENYVDHETLDQNLASIHVTHVDPFFDDEEVLERQSMFERQYNISRFMFETPFVIESHDDNKGIFKSKQTDDLRNQCKRKTILTVEASFPHIKRRLEVISTTEMDFSPIERAIDEIKSKNRELVNDLRFSKQSSASNKLLNGHSRSGNINLLMDMHLAGALLPQVNQGPLAYARVFLQKEAQLDFATDKVQQLKVEFMEFLSLCHLLLGNYYELMSQIHEQNYKAMRSALDKYRIELSNLLNEEITVDQEKMIICTPQLSDYVTQDLMKRLANDANNCA